MRSVLPRLVVGSSTSDVAGDYRVDFDPLLGRARVWILLAAAQAGSGQALFSFLDRAGTRTETFRTRDDVAVAALYDLRGV
jgi:hypothetical protein